MGKAASLRRPLSVRRERRIRKAELEVIEPAARGGRRSKCPRAGRTRCAIRRAPPEPRRSDEAVLTTTSSRAPGYAWKMLARRGRGGLASAPARSSAPRRSSPLQRVLQLGIARRVAAADPLERAQPALKTFEPTPAARSTGLASATPTSRTPARRSSPHRHSLRSRRSSGTHPARTCPSAISEGARRALERSRMEHRKETSRSLWARTAVRRTRRRGALAFRPVPAF